MKSQTYSTNSLARRMARYLGLILVMTILASCSTSPVARQQAESTRVSSQPWDPGYHDDSKGTTSRDLASVLNGLVSGR